MDKQIINALSVLGIDISDVQYKFAPVDQYGLDEDQPTKFVLKGSFFDEPDFKQFLEEIFILRELHRNSNPAVKDLYEKLRTTAGITSK